MGMSTSRSGYQALRKGRQSERGRVYLLTFVTCKRRRWFEDPAPAHIVAHLFNAPDVWRGNCVDAWVLMPDHAHVLFALETDEALPTVVARLKAVTAREANRVLHRSGPFWQGGFHDHALRTDESRERVARYIIANPMRAGLVEDPWQWPYWNSRWIDGPQDLA